MERFLMSQPSFLRTNQARSCGQTMLEALLTILLIGLVSLAIIGFQNNLNYAGNITQQQNEALLLATKQIETLRNFQVINNTAGYTAYQNINNGTLTVNGLNTNYTIDWTVTTQTNPNYKTITVTVNWLDQTQQTQSIMLVTHIGAIDPAYSAAII
jgi:Tfp pilus assembly protein PilV